MKNILFKGSPTSSPGHENKIVNTFKINYNQEYCVYSGNNYLDLISQPYALRSSYIYNYIKEFLERPEYKYLWYIISRDRIINVDLLLLDEDGSFSNSSPAVKDSIIKTRIIQLFNTYLTPCKDLRLRKGPNIRTTLTNLSIDDFINPDVKHKNSRAGSFYWGGGIFGATSIYKNGEYPIQGIFNPLVILATKTEAVQIPKLAGLVNSIEGINSVDSNYHYLQNKENLFKLFVQAGFDYKDFPSQSFRKVYKNVILPFAKEHNIEIVTVPNLKEKFFYTINLPTFNNAIEKARQEKVVMNTMINSYLSSIVPEPEPTEDPFDVLW